MKLTQDTTQQNRLAVTIANGAAVSGDIYASSDGRVRAYGFRLLSVSVPSAWTAADIGFEVSADGSTWVKVYDETGVRIKITGVATAAAGIYTAPPKIALVGMWPYLRLVSLNTSTGANENQGADRALVVAIGG
jgi:hypothetical protein